MKTWLSNVTRGTVKKHFLFVARAAAALLALGANGVLSAAAPPSGPAQIPALQWQERSDWINVKTDIGPAAIGDGQADDTVAIQRALAGVRDGSVLYFPPGTYRITAPLVLKNRTGARWIGGLIVGICPHRGERDRPQWLQT